MVAAPALAPYIGRHVVAYLFGAFPARPAGRLHPTMSAFPRRPPPAGPGWLHEVKHDGYRIVARKQGESVSLWSRHGADFTDRLPRIAEAIGNLPAERAVFEAACQPCLEDRFASSRSGGALIVKLYEARVHAR